MKKLVAGVAVAGLMLAGSVSAAAAAAPGGQGSRGHRGSRVAGQTAAAAIGISPDDLRSQVRSGKTVAQISNEHGLDPNTIVSAIVAALTQQIDQKAAAGAVDAGRAEQAKQKVPDLASRFVNETRPHRGYRVIEDAVKAAAKEIGVSGAELKQSLRDGKSIAQVAKDHDKSVEDVVNAMVNAATGDIDQAVNDGKLDASRARELEGKLPDHMKQLANRERQGGRAATPGTQ